MTKYGQPIISRETRLLLVTIAVSIAALWVLARIRFHERVATSAAVSPVLAQLRTSAGYADLALVIAEIRPGVMAAVVALRGGAPALRVREDAAVTLSPVAADLLVAADRATGLAIARSPGAQPPGLMPWAPRLLEYPRYLVAAELAGESVSLRPVFVGGLFPTSAPLWSGEIWLLPPATAITRGTFVFTIEGAFAGLAVDHDGRVGIVPAALLLRTVDRLLREGGQAVGELGVVVHPLSPAIAAASGAAAGVVVAAIDPAGPAAGMLLATDVIEAIDGRDVVTLAHWQARVARLHEGETVSLRVRSNRVVRELSLTATRPSKTSEPPGDASLGLRMKAIPKVGAEVVSVQPRSRAARAGIQPGDVITVIDQQSAPLPAQVTRAFATLPEGGSVLAAITRGNAHRVVVVEK